MSDVQQQAQAARKASKKLVTATEDQKNHALQAIAQALRKEKASILKQNQKDLDQAEKGQYSRALLDRLKLTEERLEEMASGLEELITLSDPVGEVMETRIQNGLRIEQTRTPLGVIGMIYEARPNVTVDSTGLALKTGNAILLRGSSSALHSNSILAEIIQQALETTSLPPEAVQLVKDPDRTSVRELLTMNHLIDVIIPRGGAGLIQRVVQESTVPVLETGVGNCHIYIDLSADPVMAHRIVINGKTSRPAVCNATETLLVHRDWAEKHLTGLSEELNKHGVEIRGCSHTQQLIPQCIPAVPADWETEYLDLILAVKIVDSLEEAIDHIHRYGTGHSEAILTENDDTAHRFMQGVDAAAVYHNASTRFTDGSQFGFGAEIGISTQKLHARGPMGLRELTSYKYCISGSGQIR